MADENGGEARELANVEMYLTDGDGQVTDVWLPMTYHSHSLKVPLVSLRIRAEEYAEMRHNPPRSCDSTITILNPFEDESVLALNIHRTAL